MFLCANHKNSTLVGTLSLCAQTLTSCTESVTSVGIKVTISLPNSPWRALQVATPTVSLTSARLTYDVAAKALLVKLVFILYTLAPCWSIKRAVASPMP